MKTIILILLLSAICMAVSALGQGSGESGAKVIQGAAR